MPFAAALSQHPLATHAVGEVVGQVLERIGGRPDGAIVFVTGAFAGAMEDIAATIRATLQPGALIGATSSSVLAGRREVENDAAIALWAVSLTGRKRPSPGIGARAVTLGTSRQGNGWAVTADADLAQRGATLVLLGDPHSFPTEAFVADLGRRAPGLTVVGGMASGATGSGGHTLVADAEISRSGAVGLLLPPGLSAHSFVSQGAQPVGEPLVVTRSSGTMIEEIAGRPALDRLMDQAGTEEVSVRNRMARNLAIGIVTDEAKPDFDRSDFLIRPVLGADKDRGAIAVGAEVPVGTTVQFQVRDAGSAHDDLVHHLSNSHGDGALIFASAARGSALFGRPHHDGEAVCDRLGTDAVAGMFCEAEIGPVGKGSHLHTQSAAVVMFDDPA